MIYDVAIVGAGIVGALTSRALSRFNVSVCLIERFPEPGCGATKANSAIVHAGYDPEPGSLKAALNLRGAEMMEELCLKLHVPYKKTGSLVVSCSDEDDDALETLYKRGMKNGVRGLELISKEKLHRLEPNLTAKARMALHAKTAAIVCPYLLACAAAENAADNGVALMMGRELEEYIKSGEIFELHLGGDTVKARYLINCTGVHSGRFCGEPRFRIEPVKGEYLLLDRRVEGFVTRVLFRPPGREGKGVLISPTVHGNIILGPTAESVKNPEDLDTTVYGREKIIKKAKQLLPEIDMSAVITSFSGMRAGSSAGDFMISASRSVPGLVNAAGIESPGLTAAPAIAERIVEILLENGFKAEKKQVFIPYRKPVVLSGIGLRERDAAIKKDPSYGRIVCRCEGISEGEITDAIRRNAGARTLDGVKRRTRAGMGRCQGGFCSSRVMEILSRELGVPLASVTKKGGNSKLVAEDMYSAVRTAVDERASEDEG